MAETSKRENSDIIIFPDTIVAKYVDMVLTVPDRVISQWLPKVSVLSARTRRYAISTAVCGVLIPIVTLGTVHLTAPADSGISGCAALLGAHPVPATDYPRVRSQFANSRWPDIRAAGTSYLDLAARLLTARGTDGYEAVWSYQRLSIACARHDHGD